jgi:hypothetical protein
MMHVLCDKKRRKKDIDRDGANRKKDNQENIDWKSSVHRACNTSNENKISHRWRKRDWLGMNV